ncbi:MAG: cytochrome c [Magnetococcales bacterium]|nr:cytochrome c [Magnetococcales bacterium]
MKKITALTLFGAIVLSGAVAMAHVTPKAPSKFLSMENPIDELEEGTRPYKKAARLYKSKCKKCHGEDGDGQGSAAGDMVLKPTDFTTDGYFKRADGQLFWIIRDGSKDTEMKAFGPGSDVSLSEEQIWSLVTFMRMKFGGED